MIDFLNSEISAVGGLLQNGISVMAIAFVGIVFWRSKALAPTLGALFLAGAVIWGVNNISWFERQIDKETSKSWAPMAPAVVSGSS